MMIEQFELMKRDPVPGCICEFGVWQGDGLEALTHYTNNCLGPGIPVYGFDSFEGMPVTSVDLKDSHAEVWRPGGYADTSKEAVQLRLPEAILVKGEFAKLLPLAEYGISKVRFARLDCDIYEGYRDALRLLTPCVQVGTYLLFDEGVAPNDPRYHDSIRDSGVRAIREWQEESGFKLKEIRSQWTELLCVIEENR